MIILASTSATRRSILGNAGVPFTSETPRVDERKLSMAHVDWTPAETALGLAQAKAMEVSHRNLKATVIGADQVLACNGTIYNKPVDMDDCRNQLLKLRGQCHTLISAVAGARRGELLWQDVQIATLRMRHFSDEFLEAYLKEQADRVTASVGGYQIEQAGIQLFDTIDGDHFTILGLPLLPLLNRLRDAGELPS